jgi:tetratricopeptide (TPR) repeat protein
LVPDSDWAYASRAHAHLSKNESKPGIEDIDKATSDIDKALALNSMNAYALKQQADAYAKNGLYEKAIADLNAAESLLSKGDPELVEVFDMQARFWERPGNKKNAKIARDKCNKLTNQINSN